MTPALALARCLHHPMREAVCRCPVCTRYFCRECITEHDGQFLCSRCVAELPSQAPGNRVGVRLLTSALTVGGFLLMVVFFYLLGVIVVQTSGRAG